MISICVTAWCRSKILYMVQIILQTPILSKAGPFMLQITCITQMYQNDTSWNIKCKYSLCQFPCKWVFNVLRCNACFTNSWEGSSCVLLRIHIIQSIEAIDPILPKSNNHFINLIMKIKKFLKQKFSNILQESWVRATLNCSRLTSCCTCFVLHATEQ